MRIFELPASTATVKFDLRGDIGGNSQEAIIEVDSDGGQFPFTEVEKTPNGFRLKIIGTWELGEFLAVMRELSKADPWNVYPKEET